MFLNYLGVGVLKQYLKFQSFIQQKKNNYKIFPINFSQHNL